MKRELLIMINFNYKFVGEKIQKLQWTTRIFTPTKRYIMPL